MSAKGLRASSTCALRFEGVRFAYGSGNGAVEVIHGLDLHVPAGQTHAIVGSTGAGTIDLMRTLGNPSGGLPFTVLLDRRGRLTGRKLGAFSDEELTSAVAMRKL